MTIQNGPSPNPLSADIHLLGSLLGVVIREQHGDDALNMVERVRASAKARRSGDDSAHADLIGTVGDLDLAVQRVLIKAFSNFFQLINIAEDQERIRVLRERERAGTIRETIDEAIRLLKESGRTAGEMRALIERSRVRLVMTAHPTEAKRQEILVKLRHIAQMVATPCCRARNAPSKPRWPKRSRNSGRHARRAQPVRMCWTRCSSASTS
jgi:phosphoenolpyruvate carboxylase